MNLQRRVQKKGGERAPPVAVSPAASDNLAVLQTPTVPSPNPMHSDSPTNLGFYSGSPLPSAAASLGASSRTRPFSGTAVTMASGQAASKNAALSSLKIQVQSIQSCITLVIEWCLDLTGPFVQVEKDFEEALSVARAMRLRGVLLASCEKMFAVLKDAERISTEFRQKQEESNVDMSGMTNVVKVFDQLDGVIRLFRGDFGSLVQGQSFPSDIQMMMDRVLHSDSLTVLRVIQSKKKRAVQEACHSAVFRAIAKCDEKSLLKSLNFCMKFKNVVDLNEPVTSAVSVLKHLSEWHLAKQGPVQASSAQLVERTQGSNAPAQAAATLSSSNDTTDESVADMVDSEDHQKDQAGWMRKKNIQNSRDDNSSLQQNVEYKLRYARLLDYTSLLEEKLQFFYDIAPSEVRMMFESPVQLHQKETNPKTIAKNGVSCLLLDPSSPKSKVALNALKQAVYTHRDAIHRLISKSQVHSNASKKNNRSGNGWVSKDDVAAQQGLNVKTTAFGGGVGGVIVLFGSDGSMYVNDIHMDVNEFWRSVESLDNDSHSIVHRRIVVSNPVICQLALGKNPAATSDGVSPNLFKRKPFWSLSVREIMDMLEQKPAAYSPPLLNSKSTLLSQLRDMVVSSAWSYHRSLAFTSPDKLGVTIRYFADCFVQMGSYSDASVLLTRLLEVFTSRYKKNKQQSHEQFHATLSYLGWLHLQQGKFRLSFSYYERALNEAMAVYGKKSIMVAHMLRNLCYVSAAMDDMQGAVKLIDQAQKIAIQLLGRSHQYVSGLIVVYQNMVTALKSQTKATK